MKKIKKLTKLWYSCLVDHHKDRDCWFYVIEAYGYGDKPLYRISHDGYLAKDFFEEYKTREEAYIALEKKLIKMIRDEAIWWIAATPEAFPHTVEYKEHFKKVLDQVNKMKEE